MKIYHKTYEEESFDWLDHSWEKPRKKNAYTKKQRRKNKIREWDSED